MSVDIKVPRKLIEVALPLDAINSASADEKGNPFLKGHPRNLHQWWARRPAAAARAVIFAQMVNDPGFQRGSGFRYGKNKAEAAEERRRLFKILEELGKWENSTDLQVLARAEKEIRRSWQEVCSLNKDHPEAATLFNPEELPPFLDPFAGGGAIPLEAQRLSLKTYASDLNPVAVVINKALIEIPPLFANRKPSSRNQKGKQRELLVEDKWEGVSGLVADIRHYATWMKGEAEQRLSALYPDIKITPDIAAGRPDLQRYTGKTLKVMAWIWARTVKSPNPAFSSIDVPLASTFVLSSSAGKEACVVPVIENGSYRFTVCTGVAPDSSAKNGTKLTGANFKCLLSGSPITAEYIKSEGIAGRIGTKLMAIVAKGERGRVYLAPTESQEIVATNSNPQWAPDVEFFQKALGFRIGNYGMSKWSDLFTRRQLVALGTLCDLLSDVRAKILQEDSNEGVDDGKGLDVGGRGTLAYAEAVTVFLALGIDKFADYSNTLCTWNPKNQNVGHLFTKQVVPMAWDFPEASPLVGGLAFDAIVDGIAKSLEQLPTELVGQASQQDCASLSYPEHPVVISTDPPYYSNIGYADLSDFFYVWLRRSLKEVFPSIFATASVPKAEELVATPARHGGEEKSEHFFMDGMMRAMARLASKSHPAFPVTIFYAFKQSETDRQGTTSTGWETFLEAVIKSGFTLTGTWPVRTEREARSRGQGSNALASSIVLVCRKRDLNAPSISRREFLRELNQTLPDALDEMIRSSEGRIPLAPVDVSQAIIGPGMSVFSKYSAVLESDGSPMSVRTALKLINRFLAEEDFDPDTQFCLHWFETHKWDAGKFGEADVLARAKGTGVDGLKAGGVLESASGNVRLYKWEELPSDWQPERDQRLSIWEILHHLIHKTNNEGEKCGGALLAKVQKYGESVRTLAYRLYTICERRGWASDASAYNNLVLAWESLDRAAQEIGYSGVQISLFGDDESAAEGKKVRKTK